MFYRPDYVTFSTHWGEAAMHDLDTLCNPLAKPLINKLLVIKKLTPLPM
jgi:hypothetical protein